MCVCVCVKKEPQNILEADVIYFRLEIYRS